MNISLADYETLARKAVSHFWLTRDQARAQQEASGRADRGSRSAVTAGKNMDGFVDLVKAVALENGLRHSETFSGLQLQAKHRNTILPGYFRPTKDWDLLAIREHRLVAVFEFKSQVGSFGNNFNNRCEEAIGSASDLWVAFRESAFGDAPKPFVGYLILLEDCEKSQSPVRANSRHFAMFPEFKTASYAKRYEILCRKLIQERLYDSATLLLTPRGEGIDGAYSELGQNTGLKRMVAALAGHVASWCAVY